MWVNQHSWKQEECQLKIVTMVYTGAKLGEVSQRFSKSTEHFPMFLQHAARDKPVVICVSNSDRK